MLNNYDFIVVGAGIVGMATAYKLQLKFPQKSIAVLEKESDIALHQTGRNSGVIHSGIYYKPGSYKAKNCKNGRLQLVKFAKENNINHDVCGKVIVAVNDGEISVLNQIYQRGIDNETEGIRFLNQSELKEKEPFIEGVKAIYVPVAGIIDYVAVSKAFGKKITEINKKSTIITHCEVTKIFSEEDNTQLVTTKGKFTAARVLFCGGLQSDRLAALDNLKIDMKIVGFRGDYYDLKPNAVHKINNLVYPVPDPKFPFLGVHFTRMIHGGIECGPNAVFTFKREGYNKTSFSIKDSFEALTFKGTWRLFAKNRAKGVDEYKRAFSQKLFVKALQKMMPSLKTSEVIASRSGVRAQAIDFNGNMVDDFKISVHKQNIHVLNAPSPAATACLSIADEILTYL
jgi:L-2-hydroxyglutarate oxidase